MKQAYEDPRMVALLPLVQAASRALAEAGRQRATLQVEHKGAIDLVTAVDRGLQELVLAGLAERFPGERVIAEEDASHRRPGSGLVWYVDPLDGTTNFVHGYPFHAVSIACWDGDRPLCGAVAAPELGETYIAVADQGSFVQSPGSDWRRLPGSRCAALGDALLATGFPYVRGNLARLSIALCARALHQTRGVRRGGSAALDLCYVAAGRLDGYFELELSPWDVAAGALIAQEAGIPVSDFRGGADYLWGRRIAAGAPAIHTDLLALIAAGHAEPEHNPLGTPFPGPVALGEDPPWTP